MTEAELATIERIAKGRMTAGNAYLCVEAVPDLVAEIRRLTGLNAALAQIHADLRFQLYELRCEIDAPHE